MPYNPEQQALREIEAQEQAARAREQMEQRIAEARDATAQASAPEILTDRDRLRTELRELRFPETVEAESRLRNVQEASIQTLDTYDSPVHFAKASRFAQEFGTLPGADHLIGDARSETWLKRAGADHHIDVTNTLGKDEIRAFEEEVTPESTKMPNRVDIATIDDHAVECKNVLSDEPSRSSISGWFRQADRRLEPNAEGKDYKGVIIAIPDEKLTDDARQWVENYEAAHPGVRVSERSQVKQVLAQMRATEVER